MARDQKRHVRSNPCAPKARHRAKPFANSPDGRRLDASFGQFLNTLATEMARHDHNRDDTLL